MTAYSRSSRYAIWGRLFTTAIVIYLIGFAVFVFSLPEPIIPDSPANTPQADAIVALTGDAGRLDAAEMLLEQGLGQRLLITGVNSRTTKEQLKSVLHGGARFDCCTDLGFQATDTRGNASETAEWVSEHGYKSIIVVTAYFHMPRSMLEFAAAMPQTQFVSYPVPQDPETSSSLRWRRLFSEYPKYLAAKVRIAILDRSRGSKVQ